MACCVCADRLHAVGLNREAGKIYAVLEQPGEPRLIRAGALHGQMEMAALYQHGVIGKSLADADPMVRSAAAAELHALSDTDLGTIAGRHGEAAPGIAGLRACRHSHSRP